MESTVMERPASAAVARHEEPKTLGELLETKKLEIRDLLPDHVDVNRFVKSALMASARNKDLLKCTPKSMFMAICSAAELGLDFTPAKGHAYLVPFRNNKTGTTDVQFMPGYRGLIDLAKRSGAVKNIETHIVYEKDEFDIRYGSERKLVHVPHLDGAPGKVKGAYAIAWLDDKEWIAEWMRKDQIDAIRKRSKAANAGPWVTDEEEMMRKTPLRRIAKYLPLSPDLERAIEADNRAIGFMDDDEPVVSRTAALAEIISEHTETEPDENQTAATETAKPEPDDKLPI